MVSGPDPVLWATLVHLGFFVGGFVGPLVARLTEGRKDEFVRHHSSEALNGNLTILLVYLGAYVTGFVGFIVTNVPWPLFVGLGLTVVVVLGMLAQMIMGAVRASQGRWFRYPVNIRFVPGAITRGEERPVVERRAGTRPATAPGPAKLPSPGHALREGASDVRRRTLALRELA